MLPENYAKDKSTLLPKVFIQRFVNFEQITDDKYFDDSNYIICSAESREEGQACTIWLFNHLSNLYDNDRDLALTLYLQEIFYLCCRFGEYNECCQKSEIFRASNYPLIDFKNFVVDGERIGFVMQRSYSLDELAKKSKDKKALERIDFAKMIEDVYTNLKYINSRFGISNIHFRPENIFAVKENRDNNVDQKQDFKYYVTNWVSGARTGLLSLTDSLYSSHEENSLERIDWIQKTQNENQQKYSVPEDLNNQSLKEDTSAEIYQLSLISLEIAGYEDFKLLPSIRNALKYEQLLSTAVQMLTEAGQDYQKSELQNVATVMLSREPKERIEGVEKWLIKKSLKCLKRMDRVLLSNLSFSVIEILEFMAEEYKIQKELICIKGSETVGQCSIMAGSYATFKQLLKETSQTDLIGTSRLGTPTTDWKNVLDKVANSRAIDDVQINSNTSGIKLEVLYFNGRSSGDEIAKAVGSYYVWKNLKVLSLQSNKIGNEGCAAIGLNQYYTELEELWLHDNEITDKGAKILSSNVIWDRIKVLSISKNKITDEGCVAIGSNTVWTNLEQLYLSMNQIGDAGAKAIGTNTTWKNMKILFLNNNKISDEGCVAIGSNTMWTNLVELYLHTNHIGDAGTKAIGTNTSWRNMKDFILYSNKIGDEGCVAIGSNTVWTNLEQLNLHSNQIGNAGAKSIGTNTTWRNLKILFLNNNKIGEEGCIALGSNTVWTHLEQLYLYTNHIGDAGAKSIGTNTSWRNMKELILYSNKIGDEGCIAIGSNTVWTHLEQLSLHSNQIGDAGAKSIGTNTSWKNMKELILYSNKIGDEGCVAIGSNTVWTHLVELYLHTNQIGDAGAKAMGTNTTWKKMKLLDLSDNKISDEGCIAIGSNTVWTNLEKLSLHTNHIGNAGAKSIGTNTTWRNLKVFSLGNNKIGDEGCIALGSNTVWTNLEELYLYMN